MKIRDLEILDLRFPTSLTSDGTDAVHKDPDYSAAYVILHTDESLDGHGFTFTIGRGNEVCAEAIRAFAPLVVGRDVDEIFAAPAAFWRTLGRPRVGIVETVFRNVLRDRHGNLTCNTPAGRQVFPNCRR